jgi:hypothetical protein
MLRQECPAPPSEVKMSRPAPPTIKRFPADKQRRMDHLLDKIAEGSISESERVRLEQLVAEAEQLMVDNAKALSGYIADQPSSSPAQAVPVTVWVSPDAPLPTPQG